MHGLILAGGEGARLAADGIRDPKAMVSIAGRPQLQRLCDTLEALGCETVTCLVRRGVVTSSVLAGPRRRAVPCETPSSLHTLAHGLELVPDGPVFCTMVDTVMPWESWFAVWQPWQSTRDYRRTALLAVTPTPARDPDPLHVRVDAAGWVTAIGPDAGASHLATAGVYGFGLGPRALAADLVAQGTHRMRAFLAALLTAGMRIRGIEVPRALDLDRRQDLEEANTWAPTVTP
jgi:molybdopterin-guanine dinucleotide biosynthesis protein A